MSLRLHFEISSHCSGACETAAAGLRPGLEHAVRSQRQLHVRRTSYYIVVVHVESCEWEAPWPVIKARTSDRGLSVTLGRDFRAPLLVWWAAIPSTCSKRVFERADLSIVSDLCLHACMPSIYGWSLQAEKLREFFCCPSLPPIVPNGQHAKILG